MEQAPWLTGLASANTLDVEDATQQCVKIQECMNASETLDRSSTAATQVDAQAAALSAGAVQRLLGLQHALHKSLVLHMEQAPTPLSLPPPPAPPSPLPASDLPCATSAVNVPAQLLGAARAAQRALCACIMDGNVSGHTKGRNVEAKQEFALLGGISASTALLSASLQLVAVTRAAAGSPLHSTACHTAADCAWTLCWATRWDSEASGRVAQALECGVVPALVVTLNAWQDMLPAAAAAAYLISNIVYRNGAATAAVMKWRGASALVSALEGMAGEEGVPGLTLASNAASALGNLTNTFPQQGPFEERHRTVLAAGAVGWLVALGTAHTGSPQQRALMVLSNLSQSDFALEALHEHGAPGLFVRVVEQWAASASSDSTPYAVVKAVMGLAFMFGRELECDADTSSVSSGSGGDQRRRVRELLVDVKAVDLIVDQLARCLAGEKWLGTSAEECAHALQRLAVHDGNHSALVRAGLVPHLGTLLGPEWADTPAQEHAALCASRLAFTPAALQAMRDTPGFTAAVQACVGVGDPAAARSARVVQWRLEGGAALDGEGGSGSGQPPPPPDAAAAAPLARQVSSTVPAPHIMLSYTWKYQSTVLALRDALRAEGFRVWVDVEKMSGSTLQAMAGAVEGAAVVMFTVCQAYFESANCRLEAEYAQQQGKPLIPLHMEPGKYRPKGWLGLILGTKLWYPCASATDVPEQLPALRRELLQCGVVPSGSVPGPVAAAAPKPTPHAAAPTPAPAPAPPPPPAPKAVHSERVDTVTCVEDVEAQCGLPPSTLQGWTVPALTELGTLLQAKNGGVPPSERVQWLRTFLGGEPLPLVQVLHILAASRFLTGRK